MEDERSESQSYMEHVTEDASLDAYGAQGPLVGPRSLDHEEIDPRSSVETLPEHASVIDFFAFAQDYPEKLFPLLEELRPEFQELFIEYYILHKSQSFLGETHGCIQTRIWQALRIIERAIGSFLVLGLEPTAEVLRSALEPAGLDATPCGSLSEMVARYAKTHSYAAVAKWAGVKLPMIRKIFRPAIEVMEESSDLKVAAIGAYLHNLTHQSALKQQGISKRAIARLERMNTQYFDAPPLNNEAIIAHHTKNRLTDEPWYMLELAADQSNELDVGAGGRRHYNHDPLSMLRLQPVLLKQLKKLFKTDSVEIFAPVNKDGELVYGYLFARTTGRVRNLLKIRGIAFMATKYISETESEPILVPDEDVQNMIETPMPAGTAIHEDDFVEILTGPASRYCGTVSAVTKKEITVRVSFPTGREFVVCAHPSSLKKLSVPKRQRMFWGIRS